MKPKVRTAFDQQHKEVYGTAATGEIPDIVNSVRVMSLAEVAKLDLPELPKGDKTPKPVAQRKVLFDEAPRGLFSTHRSTIAGSSAPAP